MIFSGENYLMGPFQGILNDPLLNSRLLKRGLDFFGPKMAPHFFGPNDVILRRACMPASIVLACGLVHPPPWCGRRFSAMGQGVKFSLVLPA